MRTEVIEPRNFCYRECRRFLFGVRQNPTIRNGMGRGDSPGSESMARSEGIAMNVGGPHRSLWKGVSPDKSKQRGRRDGGVGFGEAVVPTKRGNARGGKGLRRLRPRRGHTVWQ